MKKRAQKFAAVLAVLLSTACVEVPPPQETAQSAYLDAGLGGGWFSDAAAARPPTGRGYTGPDCASLGDLAEPQTSAASFGDAAAPGPGSVPLSFDGAVAYEAVAESGPDGDLAREGRMPSQAGEVRISELMPNPVVIDDSAGEWLELHNPGPEWLELQGCALDDGGSSARAIDGALALEPEGYAVVARSERADVPYDYLMAFSLGNSTDSVALLCGGVEIDRVAYGDGGAPEPGRSLARDAAGRWCLGEAFYGDNRGSPGAANPPCDGGGDDHDAGT